MLRFLYYIYDVDDLFFKVWDLTSLVPVFFKLCYAWFYNKGLMLKSYGQGMMTNLKSDV